MASRTVSAFFTLLTRLRHPTAHTSNSKRIWMTVDTLNWAERRKTRSFQRSATKPRSNMAWKRYASEHLMRAVGSYSEHEQNQAVSVSHLTHWSSMRHRNIRQHRRVRFSIRLPHQRIRRRFWSGHRLHHSRKEMCLSRIERNACQDPQRSPDGQNGRFTIIRRILSTRNCGIRRIQALAHC